MYDVVECLKRDKKKTLEFINDENLKIVWVLDHNEDWYEIIVEKIGRVVY